jgi:hypothetical protein
MAEIPGEKTVVDVVGRWNPSDIAFVNILTLDVTDDGAAHLQLTARLQPRYKHLSWPSNDREWFIIKLEFSAVRDFCVRGMGPGALQVMGFEIEDVAGRGLEGVRYRIGDYEDDKISFFCTDVEIADVAPERANERTRFQDPDQ